MAKVNKRAGSKGGKATAEKYPKGASARGKAAAARKTAGFPTKKGKLPFGFLKIRQEDTIAIETLKHFHLL